MNPIQNSEGLFRPWELEANRLKNVRSEEKIKLNNPLPKGEFEHVVRLSLPKCVNIENKSTRRNSDSEVEKLHMKRPRFDTNSTDSNRTKNLFATKKIDRIANDNAFRSRLTADFLNPRHPQIPFLHPYRRSFLCNTTSEADRRAPRPDSSSLVAESVKRKRPKDKACTKCKNTFSNQAQLDAHMRGHDNVRNYVCEYLIEDTKKKCGKKFVRKEELTRHQRTHTGEKPHLCKICSKGFGRKDHLQKHERTHEKNAQQQLMFSPGSHPSFLFPTHIGGIPPYPHMLLPPHQRDMPVPVTPSDYMVNFLAYQHLLPRVNLPHLMVRNSTAGAECRIPASLV